MGSLGKLINRTLYVIFPFGQMFGRPGRVIWQIIILDIKKLIFIKKNLLEHKL